MSKVEKSSEQICRVIFKVICRVIMKDVESIGLFPWWNMTMAAAEIKIWLYRVFFMTTFMAMLWLVYDYIGYAMNSLWPSLWLCLLYNYQIVMSVAYLVTFASPKSSHVTLHHVTLRHGTWLLQQNIFINVLHTVKYYQLVDSIKVYFHIYFI